MNRRAFLAAGGGLAAAAFGLREVDRFRARHEGTVFWRQVAADTDDGVLVVMIQSYDADGDASARFHPDYRDAFETAETVPKALHDRLNREYGLDEPWYAIRYDGHDCNGIPGDEGGGFEEISRDVFNETQLGTCVKMR